MPGVKKAAFIIGGEYGEGALRSGGETVDYYNIVSGSIGFQIGVEAKDIIIAFMTQEALDGFRASSGWEAGVDGVVVEVGAKPPAGKLTELRQAIDKLTFPPRKRTKVEALLPHINGETKTVTEEEEEEGE